tara:strand:- start:832 stop:1116 length:285 start_codon:yes stop_codon:yes gene_type:complete
MSSAKVVRTILPIAPVVYDSNYVNQLARNLDRVIDEQRQPLLNIPDMPSDGSANVLEEGDLYEANGFVKIKKVNEVHSGSEAMVSSVGTVTVST